jgi:hypothetical protein
MPKPSGAVAVLVAVVFLVPWAGGGSASAGPTLVPTVGTVAKSTVGDHTAYVKGCLAAAPDKELTLGALPATGNQTDPKTSVLSPLPSETPVTSTRYYFHHFYGKGGCPNSFIVDLHVKQGVTSLPTTWDGHTPLGNTKAQIRFITTVGGLNGKFHWKPSPLYAEDFKGIYPAPDDGSKAMKDDCTKMWRRNVYAWKKHGDTQFHAYSGSVSAFRPDSTSCLSDNSLLVMAMYETDGIETKVESDPGLGQIPPAGSGEDVYRIIMSAGLLAQPASSFDQAHAGYAINTAGIWAFWGYIGPDSVAVDQEFPVAVYAQGT